LAAYVQPYFDLLLQFWESHEIDEALVFVKSMYPMTIVTPEVVALTDKWLTRDLPGPVRRSLLESRDGIKRAMRTRAFDSAR
jgi:aminopeptidase N